MFSDVLVVVVVACKAHFKLDSRPIHRVAALFTTPGRPIGALTVSEEQRTTAVWYTHTGSLTPLLSPPLPPLTPLLPATTSLGEEGTGMEQLTVKLTRHWLRTGEDTAHTTLHQHTHTQHIPGPMTCMAAQQDCQ